MASVIGFPDTVINDRGRRVSLVIVGGGQHEEAVLFYYIGKKGGSWDAESLQRKK